MDEKEGEIRENNSKDWDWDNRRREEMEGKRSGGKGRVG